MRTIKKRRRERRDCEHTCPFCQCTWSHTYPTDKVCPFPEVFTCGTDGCPPRTRSNEMPTNVYLASRCPYCTGFWEIGNLSRLREQSPELFHGDLLFCTVSCKEKWIMRAKVERSLVESNARQPAVKP